MKDDSEKNVENPKNPWENYEELRRVVWAASIFSGLEFILRRQSAYASGSE